MSSWFALTLDTKAPTLNIIAPETIVAGSPITVDIVADEDLSPLRGTFRLIDSSGFVKLGQGTLSGNVWHVVFGTAGLRPGPVQLYCEVEDLAGNRASQSLILGSPAATFCVGSGGGVFEETLSFGNVTLDVPAGAFVSETPVGVLEDPFTYPLACDGIYRRLASGVRIDFGVEPALPVRVFITYPQLEDRELVVMELADGVWRPKLTPEIAGTVVSFELASSSTIAVFANDFPLAEGIDEAFAKWPRWTAIRRYSDSIGRKLINLELLEAERARRRSAQDMALLALATCPVDLVDIIYRADLPRVVVPGFKLEFMDPDEDKRLVEVDSPQALAPSVGLDAVYVDYDRRIAYFSAEHNRVRVRGSLESSDGVVMLPPVDLSPVLHHVWNMFDEYGLLLGTPRLYGERNAEYRDRLFAVGAYPANPTHFGLVYGIARLLGLIKVLRWDDDSQPLTIVDSVLPGSVRVDWQPVSGVEYGEDICVIPPLTVDEGYGDGAGRVRKVSYVPNAIYVHTLGDQRDERLKALLYNIDGSPTDYHRELAEAINKVAPIMWDYFRYDDAFWDVIDKSMTGVASVPNLYDADVEAWRAYKP